MWAHPTRPARRRADDVPRRGRCGTTRERGLTRTVEPRRATRGDAVVAADAKRSVARSARSMRGRRDDREHARTRLQGRVGRTDSVEVCGRPWHTSHLPRCLLIARTPACGGFPRARFPAMSYDRALSLALGHSRDAPRARDFVRSLDRSFGTSVSTQTRAPLRCFTAPPYPPRTLGCSTRRANFVGARWTPRRRLRWRRRSSRATARCRSTCVRCRNSACSRLLARRCRPPSAGSPCEARTTTATSTPIRTPRARLPVGRARASSRGTTTTRPTTPSPTESPIPPSPRADHPPAPLSSSSCSRPTSPADIGSRRRSASPISSRRRRAASSSRATARSGKPRGSSVPRITAHSPADGADSRWTSASPSVTR